MLILDLYRTYFPLAANGEIWYNDNLLCYAIELPWRDNLRGVSCIPEGEYRLQRRYSNRFKHHIEIVKVPDRSYILIHSANNANKELKGCIAPVMKLDGIGKGQYSKNALEKLKQIVYPFLDKGEEVWLRIKERI